MIKIIQCLSARAFQAGCVLSGTPCRLPTSWNLIKILLENGERVELELEVVYNTTPILRSGFWHVDGKHYGSGNVLAKSLKFLGGQGEAPSIGGRFELKEDSRSRFRVVVPLRPVNKQNWWGKNWCKRPLALFSITFPMSILKKRVYRKNNEMKTLGIFAHPNPIVNQN